VRSTRVDLYGVLGVARSATVAELRRAYRRKALAHHPDRAGAASASTFAGIADAYRVLSNPVARSAYDASLAEQDAWNASSAGGGSMPGGSVRSGGVDWTVSTNRSNGTGGAAGAASRWKATTPATIVDLLPRVSGRLDVLIQARIAAIAPDGLLELRLHRREATTGGTAVIEMPLKVVCPTCGGVARPRGVWCRSCEHQGFGMEDVAVAIRVPRHAESGSILAISIPGALDSPVRVRFRVHGLRPLEGDDD
jgi:molecular chaperone DnaJ